MRTCVLQTTRRIGIILPFLLMSCGKPDSSLEPETESANAPAADVESSRATWIAEAEANPAKKVGTFEPIECQAIHGWAWDPKNPDETIKVEIFDGDRLITTVAADKFRKDLADLGFGNGKHSFQITPPKELLDGNSHTLHAKFAGTNVDLRTSPQPLICTEDDASRTPQERIDGTFDTADCQSIRGWAWDPKKPNEPVKVDIYDGDKFVIVLVADKFRQDLADAGYGNGKHAFEMVPPLKLCDGNAHAIHVKFSGRPVDLKSSPRTLLCADEKSEAAPPALPK